MIPVALYAITASYFAGVMVRLILTLAPVVCVLSAIAFSECFSFCLVQDDETKPTRKKLSNSNNADNNSESDDSESGVEKKTKKSLYDKVTNFITSNN